MVDAFVRGEEFVGGWPGVDDADDHRAGTFDDAGGCVPERPSEPFRLRVGEVTGAAHGLEPTHQVSGDADEVEPGTVGVEVAERESFESGVFQAFDVVFDVGVLTHVPVQLHRVGGAVGVVAPISVDVGGEQGTLRTGVQVFTAHDQPGPRWPRCHVDQVGDFGNLGTLCDVTGAASGRVPSPVRIGGVIRLIPA